uniref:structure-specific endonuclease subunit SLX4 isoform X3 n=1 Tax=Jaculus jaculus TaxID=51337 RepID=UPI001E1AFA2D|nr:structure-specific endonuclease subunit SLX4 isoform X3 [Jaculus jaculus]
MAESDDDFKELCASFFQRVKKKVTKEVLGERKTQKASNTQKRSKLKKTNQAATKSKTLQGPSEKKPRSGGQGPRTKKQGVTKSQDRESAVPVNGQGGVLAPAPDQPLLCSREQRIQTESAPNSDSQPPASCLTTIALPNPSRPRASELVLQRMQQFKRAEPERLRHASEESFTKATLEESVPKSLQEETVLGNDYQPGLPATKSDAAVALALQQELGREGAPACDNGLEEEGLFFCQMCQKNLSAMNVTRREQHVNRCLDEAEKALRPSTPQIPDCPICGKPFSSYKSRVSHLKQCAVKMEVGPQLLLQAVHLQTAQSEVGSSPQAPSFSNQAGGLKRKGTTKKEPQKRRKVNKPEAPSEDLLVAMALSRSEMEQDAAMPTLRLENAFSKRMRLGAEKKSRKKKTPGSPPQLLVQDSKTTGRQIEDRVAQLLSEEMEMSSTPPLPTSRIFQEELEEAGWRLQPPKGKRNYLWEGSTLTEAWAEECFYTAGLLPLVMPQPPATVSSASPSRYECEPPLVLPEQPKPEVQRPPALHSSPPAGQSPRNSALSASQREHQALQDLLDLAEEGLNVSQWPSSSGGPVGLDLVPSSLPLTGFVLPSRERPLQRAGHASVSLGLLVADFKAMVNNPHLSDVQFQTDSGEVLYSHKFILYARCPLLMQYVNSEGFCAAEDGDLTQRVLLSDVSSEATHAFLSYLYTADTDLPPRLAPDLHALALRFGVSDLAQQCEKVPDATDSEGEQPEQGEEDCEGRAENFQELLRSVWADDEEDAEPLLKSESHEEDREEVNEAEMEEIYEFAATQRKLLQVERAADTGNTDQPREDSPVAGPALGGVQGDCQLEKLKQMESPGLGKDKAPASLENARYSLVMLQGQVSDGAGEEEVPREAAGCPGSCTPSGGHQTGRKGSLLHSVKARDFPSTQRFSELSQVTVDHRGQCDTVRERAEMVHPTIPRQAPQQHPCLSQPAGSGSPSQSWLQLYHTGDLSPLSVSQSHSGDPKVASPSLPSPSRPAKQRRNSGILTLLQEPSHQKGRRGSSVLECKNRGILISPAKSPPIDLTQSKPDHLSPRAQHLPCCVKKEDEIILLLDSDEELELEQTKTKLAPNDPPEERQFLEVSPKSSELFSVIDIDEEQERLQSPLKTEAEPQLECGEGQLENQAALGSRGIPWLFRDRESGPDEDSTADSSWLVPATPLVSQGRDCSSQTQITSLGTKAAAEETAPHMSQASTEHSRAVPEAAQKFPVIVPHILPVPIGVSEDGRQAYKSPSHPHPSPFQKPSPPGPCLPHQAAADEVVEVGDSDDEQQVASRQVNSSPLLDSDPLIPMSDCCWHDEPLSPIPIDHLNLERTGPLSTSSPRRQSREALDGGDCHSPRLLGTATVRGSFAVRSDGQEQSSQADSILNPALWDDWDGAAQSSPEAVPAAQMPSTQAQKPEGPKTPSSHQKKNLPPKVPITPMPRYSIMETPVLKKELHRFGVRPLPKRQMVLKLKEIFQYTHQTLESDSEGEIQSSQVPPEVPYSQTSATVTSKPSRPGSYNQRKATPGPGTRRSKGPIKSKGPRRQAQQSREGTPHTSWSPVRELPAGPDGDAQLPASQESTATSVDSSDSSFSSQSSSYEFGAALESAGDDEEGEAGVSASQAAMQAADTEAAVRRYICAQPALYRKVLMYQPLELAELQAELKQGGIHVAMGKLLDILDAQCITFTTAAARKEKLRQKKRQRFGRKKKEQE